MLECIHAPRPQHSVRARAGNLGGLNYLRGQGVTPGFLGALVIGELLMLGQGRSAPAPARRGLAA